ncbi:MAG: segregation/condensation protein A [candidate division Zixibacteria bacterium]|nr:segregation/condensation protein A [candidate division Zixibacteria bacterium]
MTQDAPNHRRKSAVAVDDAPEPHNGNGHGGADTLSFKLDVFEGPLDLLLFLIRKDEIDITDIPIAKITAEYLSMLRLMESCDLEIAGEYIVMAATLLRIKSAMLLPRDPESDEEEDPREELVQALLEYRKFKEGAAILDVREEDERGIYARSDFALGPLPSKSRFVMDQTLFDLLSAFHDVVVRIEPDTVHRVTVAEQTVEERIAELDLLLDQTESIEFAALFAGLAARWLVIVTFLAVLELVRLRRISVKQGRPFGELTLERVVQ